MTLVWLRYIALKNTHQDVQAKTDTIASGMGSSPFELQVLCLAPKVFSSTPFKLVCKGNTGAALQAGSYNHKQACTAILTNEGLFFLQLREKMRSYDKSPSSHKHPNSRPASPRERPGK